MKTKAVPAVVKIGAQDFYLIKACPSHQRKQVDLYWCPYSGEDPLRLGCEIPMSYAKRLIKEHNAQLEKGLRWWELCMDENGEDTAATYGDRWRNAPPAYFGEE